jgi:hypothetical protein
MKRVFSIGLLVGLLSLFAVIPATAMELSFQPVNQTVPLGSFATVNLIATPTAVTMNEILAAYDLDLMFDPTILSFNSLTFGTALGDLNLFEAVSDALLVSPGKIDFMEVSFLSGADLDALQNGPFTLATIKFGTIGLGTSPLTLDGAFPNMLVGPGDPPPSLPQLLDSGTITVTQGGTVPEPASIFFLGACLVGLMAHRMRSGKA